MVARSSRHNLTLCPWHLQGLTSRTVGLNTQKREELVQEELEEEAHKREYALMVCILFSAHTERLSFKTAGSEWYAI